MFLMYLMVPIVSIHDPRTDLPTKTQTRIARHVRRSRHRHSLHRIRHPLVGSLTYSRPVEKMN